MKKILLNAALLIFCLSLGAVFFFLNYSASAQSSTDTRPTTVPTVSPTPVVVGTPPPLTVDDPNDIIKIDTELVNLNVRVVDRMGRPVANLRKEDFTVYEDQVRQPIEWFSQAEVPTNYALVIDNSGSLRFQLEKVIEAGKTIISTNKADDETGVIRFVSSDKIEILQDFTNSKGDLNDALDNMYIEGGQTAIIDAVYLAVERVNDYEQTGSFDTKRRALILVSDGEDRSSYYKEEQLFKLLREADVQIFAIGFVNELDSDGNFIRKSPQKKAKDFLTRLATETGGKAYFPNTINELPSIASNIASELRTQYSIGYLPNNDKPEGAYRNIKVEVRDGPNKEKRITKTRAGVVIDKKKSSKPSFQKAN